MKTNIKKNWPRYVLQWGTLAALIFFLSGLAKLIFTKMDPADPEAYCPLGGLEALVTYGVRGSLPCSMSSLQIMMGIVLAAAVVLFSKLFCGYLCPAGTLQDLLLKLRNKLKIKPLNIKQRSIADKILRIFKYALVFWIFYMTSTASELFCKRLDPYYAIATGFKGEIVLWMSIVTVTLLVLGGFFIDMFWCKYLCPLGAISNSLKFWAWILGLYAIYFVLGKIGLDIPWIYLLGAFCLAGYLLEILCANPKLQLLHIIKEDDKCSACGLCNLACPYHIDITGAKGRINSVDCTLCGECTAACAKGAIAVGLGKKTNGGAWKYIPAVITLLLLGIGFWLGSTVELPTIDETWGIEKVEEDGTVTQLVDKSTLETMEIMPLRSVKCFSSSMAFKGKVSQIKGTHGVKTYVHKHRVVITYDPKVTNPDIIQEAVFVPSKFRVSNPDPAATPVINIVTIRTEGMPDRMDLNNLGMQMRLSGKKIYGLESEFACPLIVRVFMDPEEEIDEQWFKEIVEKKSLEMPLANGGVKVTPLDFRFVKMEKGVDTIPTPDYIKRIFTPFKAEFNGKYDDGIKKRVLVYEGQPQFIYEIADQNYEKPIVTRNLPFLSNHISREEGIIGVYCVINEDLIPALQVRFAEPCTAERIWELMTMETWTITYSPEDVREVPAKLTFKNEGVVKPWKEE